MRNADQRTNVSRPYYGTPLALDIPSSQGSLDLSGVSIPKGDGYVILMTDVNNSSHIVSGLRLYTAHRIRS